MNSTTAFDRCLLALYRGAMRERRWTAAEHLLSAIESSALPDGNLGNSVAQAYRTIALMAVKTGKDTSNHSAPSASRKPNKVAH